MINGKGSKEIYILSKFIYLELGAQRIQSDPFGFSGGTQMP